MKYTFLLLFFIYLPSFSMDKLYQLPSTKKIEQRLNRAGLHNFARQSKIADAIGERFFQPLLLHTYITSQVLKYNSSLHEWTYESFKNKTLDTNKPTVSVLMTLLLKDYPRAITALEKNYDGAFLR